jgi:hypothetical protein
MLGAAITFTCMQQLAMLLQADNWLRTSDATIVVRLTGLVRAVPIRQCTEIQNGYKNPGARPITVPCYQRRGRVSTLISIL